MNIRTARPEDAEALVAIYAPYVLKTAITFEYNVPSIEEFRTRIECISAKYPYLVAEANGIILGYAYAGQFRGRDAYRWAVETSIYVDEHHKRQGIGKKLHEALETALKKQGILNMNACITFKKGADEHITLDSIKFHAKLGYRKVAHFHKCGYRFGRWFDIVWMEKAIGRHNNNMKTV